MCLNFTFDDLALIFAHTIGSIRGSLGMVLWSWTKQAQLSIDYKTFPTITWMFIYWSLIVISVKLLSFINKKLSKPPQWEISHKTTILITGGAQGLGLLLAAQFSSQKFKVVIFDKIDPVINVANCDYFQVDVSDYDALKKTISNLDGNTSKCDTNRYILINCAGCVIDSMGDFTSIDPQAVQKVISTNLMGSIWMTQEMMRRNLDMVVFISSSTSLASPAKAGIYASSKAGISTFAKSLRYELKDKDTRVLNIVPGQLDTKMFENIKTPSEFWAPVISSSQLSLQIYNAILRGETGEILVPQYTKVLPYVILLPQSILNFLRRIIGVDESV